MFRADCVSPTDVGVIGAFWDVVGTVDPLPPGITVTSAISLLTRLSVAEVTGTLTGTVLTKSCTGTLCEEEIKVGMWISYLELSIFDKDIVGDLKRMTLTNLFSLNKNFDKVS